MIEKEFPCFRGKLIFCYVFTLSVRQKCANDELFFIKSLAGIFMLSGSITDIMKSLRLTVEP
jgi:hypothetical protein